MSVDYLTTAAMADEIRDRLLGARVQDVLQPDRLTVQLELYAGQRWYLTLTADGAREGIRLAETKGRRGEGPPTPLLLALRARVEGARLERVDQPPYERILDLVFHGATEVHLIAELMGRLANLMLVDADGTILAAARRVTAQMSRARVVLPGRPYAPPPAPAKMPPDEVTLADVDRWRTAEPDMPMDALLVRQVRAMSPLAAREILARATTDSAPSSAAIVRTLADLFALPKSRAWEPCVAVAETSIVAYAPYRLTQYADVRPLPTISAAIAAFEDARLGSDPYRAARAAAAAEIAAAEARLRRRAESLARQRDRETDVELLRLFGDLILAYQTRIRPGQTSLDAPYEPDSPPLAIPLDSALSPLENAQAYYKRHRRARRAAAEIPERMAEVEAALATLEQLALDLDLAEDRPAIDAVHDSLIESGYLSTPARRRAPGPSGPLQIVSSDGFTLLVGRNSRQNEVVTFQRAARDDLWLHAHGVPGAHVLVKCAGRPVPERTLHEAAGLAAHFSRSRDQALVTVDVTEARHVRRMRGGGAGMVIVGNARAVTVAPCSPAELG